MTVTYLLLHDLTVTLLLFHNIAMMTTNNSIKTVSVKAWNCQDRDYVKTATKVTESDRLAMTMYTVTKQKCYKNDSTDSNDELHTTQTQLLISR